MAKSEKQTSEFLNPFDKGVNYKMFLDAIPSGTTVKDFCKGHLTEEQINWLEEDLKHYKK